MTDLPSAETIERMFVESGEKERLKEVLIQRLEECGWNSQVRICWLVRLCLIPVFFISDLCRYKKNCMETS